MRVFGIERPEDVTPNDRRNAKAVNFGVVYGISDFGLSNNLGISRLKKAKAYIDTYFERFPGIKNYMDEVVREARDKGYVETLFKRRVSCQISIRVTLTFVVLRNVQLSTHLSKDRLQIFSKSPWFS